MASAKKARNELPHPIPSVAYILGAASGSPEAMMLRTMVLEASADAA